MSQRHRRESVRLQDIVLSTPSAKNHYLGLRGTDDVASLPSVQESMTIKLPNGEPLTIDCDPLLIAEFLHMQEKGGASDDDDDDDEEKDDYEVENPASMNSGEIRRTSTVPFRQEGSMRKMSRKRSAMDEHDRIKRALEDSGFLLE